MVESRQHSLTVAAEEAGQRLDRWLSVRLPDLSRSRLKGLIESGQVQSAGAALSSAARKVKVGETIVLEIPPAAPAKPAAQAMDLVIPYEDEHLIVVMKPAGLVVHPAPGNPDRTLVNALIAHCGDSLQGIGGEQRPGIVHRLDKDTSGLLVAAKSETIHRALVEQFAARTVQRRYLALVWGRPLPPRGRIEGAIGRSPHNRKKMALVERGGRAAITDYETLESFAGGRVSLVACRLQTGRTHQIRVHLTARGHPLLGDPLYGRRDGARANGLTPDAAQALRDLKGQALHAASLGFIHPVTAKPLKFEEELPYEIKRLIALLE